MKYNFKDLRKRVKGIEGGYGAVSKELGVTDQRLRTILSGTTHPRESTMMRLNKALKKLEQARDQQREEHAEIFLP
ncbi:hypothetical protein F5984_13100 [Rudanella paleaurantiibacter]|uniref:Uncharacterized protein n=1 Tax=Rudanella paleaurantiibacter TaxID=2614655 RepID=A0A7J5TYC5_9BACT|nr:hypothetical protein [Rudanella paleaurantiibacter]KAB7730114.1 hypothetical protein F5984_13100 [Rudanella paleaurantiibacter]